MTRPGPGFELRALGLLGFIAASVVLFYVLLNTAGGVDIGERYRLTAVVPTTHHLSVGADVRQNGVEIGRVKAISNRGATAVVEIAIDPDRGPVHRDGSVKIGAKTPVGENYLELDPGTEASPALPDGGELPIERAKPSVQVDEILSVFRPKRQARLRRLLSGLGEGVADSEALGRTVGGFADLAIEGADVTAALATQRQALADFVADFGTIFAALGERRETIQRLVGDGRRAAIAFSSESDALRDALRRLPGALTQVERTTERLAAVGERAGPVLDDLTVALIELVPVNLALPGAAGRTLDALQRLGSATPAARRLLRSLRRTAAPTAAMVPRLDGLLRELRPALEYLRPYSRDAGMFFAATGQAVTTRDATGHMARLLPIITPNTLTTLGEEERLTIEELLPLGLARLVNLRGFNAYPEPNTLATPVPFEGPYPRVERDEGR